MKLLITGGFGYLGGRVAKFLASQSGYEILIGSRQQTVPPLWLPQAKPIQTHWEKPASLDSICIGVDSVVHLAGVNAQASMADPVGALEFNGVATARLLAAAIRQGVKRFIYLSTGHVYGSPLRGEITEEVCPVNLHPYATSHRAGEDVVRTAHQRGEIEGVVIRLSNAYGAPTHKDANCWMLLVNDLCRQAVMTQRMVLRSSGVQRRDFITLTDAARAIKHLLDLPTDKLGNGVFNVGGAWSPTILEMVQHLAERINLMTGISPKISRQEDQIEDNSECLDYRIDKLLDTGFKLSGSDSINQEIDGLIQFCVSLPQHV